MDVSISQNVTIQEFVQCSLGGTWARSVFDSVSIDESISAAVFGAPERAANLREVMNLVDELVKDYSNTVKPDERARAIRAAVYKFSKDRPRQVVYDITANGSYDYLLPNVLGKEWVDGFSYVASVEYPAGEQIPSIVDESDYTIYDSGTRRVLRFLSSSPQSGYTIRMKYTTPWLLSKDFSTIKDIDAHPVAALAASLCLRMVASYYMQTAEPSMAIDVIDYSRKSVEANLIADALENIYRDHLGQPRLGERANQAAAISASSFSKDLDIQFEWQEDYLTHPQRNR